MKRVGRQPRQSRLELRFSLYAILLLAISSVLGNEAPTLRRSKVVGAAALRLRGASSGVAGETPTSDAIHVADDEDEPVEDYDLVVIGGGSGGLACAQEAARLGKKVAVCDFVRPSPAGSSWGLGGTCVNVGCIPKKLMHQAALLGAAVRDARAYGWETTAEDSPLDHSWPALVQGVQMHIKSQNFGYRSALMTADVEYINSFATLQEGGKEVLCRDGDGEVRRLRARAVVVATGGRPRYLDKIPGGRDLVISSDDLFSLPKAPGKTLCIGGGYIALECAGLLHGLGMDAHVMVRSRPLREFDCHMGDLVAERMASLGVKFLHKAVPVAIERAPGDGGRLRVTWKDMSQGPSGEHHTDEYDTVLVAVGRRAETKGMGLEDVGVELHPASGKIVTGEDEATSVPGVYAIGDVAHGRPELTPAAIQAGKLLARRLFGDSNEVMDYTNVPTTVFTPLEYACVGLSEDQANQQLGEDAVEVYHTYFRPLEWALPHGPENACYAKVICDRTRDMKVVGLHILGPGAGEMMQGFAVAVKLGVTKTDIDATVGIHPTNAENVMDMTVTKRSGVDPRKQGC